MPDQQQEEFLARAEQLGHDRATLLSKGEHSMTVTVNSIDDLRKLMLPADQAVRDQRQAHILAKTAGQPMTLADHIEGYLHGTHELSEEHRAAANEGFPVKVNLVAKLEPHTMPHGETVIGPSASPTVWTYDTLNFYSDSYLTVKNTYFTLNVTTLVMQYTGS